MIPQSNYKPCSSSNWLKTVIYTFTLILTCFTLSAQTDTTCTAKVGNFKGTSICFLDDQTLLKAAYQVNAIVPQGFEIVYLLAYANQATVKPVIQQIANEPVFALPDSLKGIYTVHELVYNPTTLNLSSVVLNETTVAKLYASLLAGGGAICGALDLGGVSAQFGECENPCNATAGRLVATANPCVKGGEAKITASIQSAPIIPAGYQRLYALVNSDNGAILRFGSSLSFTVGAAGNYGIHTLIYDTATLRLDPLFDAGIVTLTTIDTLLIQGGGDICGALDKVGATFELENCPDPCQAKAGTLAVNTNPCLKDSAIVISALTKDSPLVPAGHKIRYLLSTGAAKFVQRIDTIPAFAVRDSGTYRIHTLVYDPDNFNPDSLSLDSLTVAAIDLAVDTLCGDADLVGAVFNVKACPVFICSANAGVLVANDSTCLFNGKATLTAKVGVASLAPFGYKTIYLLSSGDSLIIRKMGATPAFEVTVAGRYAIHTLVYDTATIKIDSIKIGQTTVSVLNDLLLQGGGTFCGALDTTGAVFQLKVCPECPAKAGTLTSNTDPCLKDSVATLTAYNSVLPVVPTGFKLAYLLSGGTGKVIEQVSDSASFVVNRMDGFAIHTLVYDFALFRLDSIKLGVTTIDKLNSQFIQGGGTMCGALDTKGFSYFVIPCPIICDAKAGSLKSIGQTCLQDTAIIEAAFNTAPVVPAGFVVRYLLSVTDLEVIRQISTTASFAVTQVGEYKIHILVYDPAVLNINNIKLNITSIDEVNSWLLSGGGDVCGAVDTQGLNFEVLACEDDCDMDVGQLNHFNPFVCITNGIANLSAFIQGNPFVPAGFKVKYLLTSGANLVIQQTSDNPVFRVNRTGRFAIHTLVYNPNTLSITSLILGSTRLSELNQQLIQGDGIICAGLDMTGVVFQVGTCLGDGDSQESELRAYPNPATQKVNLVLPHAENVLRTTVELINANGDIVNQWQIDGYNEQLYLDVSNVQPGVYYARVYYDGNFVQQTSVVRAQ